MKQAAIVLKFGCALNCSVVQPSLCNVCPLGFGPSVARDMMQLRAQLPIQSAAVAENFSRWLRKNMEYLVKHPEYVCAYGF